MGTRSDQVFSRGSTLPLVQRPWAMTAWCPVTSDAPQVFHPDTPRLRGVRASSQTRSDRAPAFDGLDFTLCPQTGPLVLDPRARASAYRRDASKWAPHRWTGEFLRYRVSVDLVPTERCALVRFTYADRGARLLVEGPGARWEWHPEVGELRGSTDGTGHQGYFVATFSQAVVGHGIEGSQVWVEFEGGRGAVVEARVATSRRGWEFAQASLVRELGDRSLETLAEEGALAWERLLGRFDLEGDPGRQETFYSCLYRCLCVPRKVDERDGEGRVAPGPLVEDPALGAHYRTLYPLLALGYRDELPALLEAWGTTALADPGAHPELAAVFAEAVSKGLGAPAEVWDSLVHHRREATRVSDFLARCAFDWCLAQWGHTLGHGAASRGLDEASRRWQDSFDLSMGFFRPREPDGSWSEGFRPLAWNQSFEEGTAWQGGWSVPHDPEGLFAALGGAEVALARLDSLLALKPLYSTPDEEVQGMTQMALADWGQYVHSLPSSHGILWHYALLGRPDKTEKLTRRVVDELYGPAPEGFCGPEVSALASWYVWACLGLYPLCPGAPDYVLGSPLFDRVTVNSGDGRTLVIETKGRGTVVVRRTLAHLTLHQPRVAQADLFDLGLLVCHWGE